MRSTAGSEQSQAVVVGIDGSDSVVSGHATRGLRVDNAGTSLQTGRTTIATAGSAAQLNGGSSVACKSVMVCALRANTNTVAIGDSNVNADPGVGNERGISLDPGEKVAVDVSDVNVIYLDVLGDGHGVTWTVIA